MEFLIVNILAGKTTTDDELEEMLESGNPSIFTSDVSMQVALWPCVFVYIQMIFFFNFQSNRKFISISLLFLFFKDYIRFTDY